MDKEASGLYFWVDRFFNPEFCSLEFSCEIIVKIFISEFL